MERLVFFGDSITDSGTSVHPETAPGHGFIRLLESSLMLDFPKEREIINKGINGHTTQDLLNRIWEDVIDLKPDIVTILVGVNDVNQMVLKTEKALDEKESYDALEKIVLTIKEELPKCKMILMEPFIFRGIVTDKDFKTFSEEVPKRRENMRKIAEKYNIPFIPLQKSFNDALGKMPENYWLLDGVHPTPAGHEIIKREWIKTFKSL